MFLIDETNKWREHFTDGLQKQINVCLCVLGGSSRQNEAKCIHSFPQCLQKQQMDLQEYYTTKKNK